MHLIQKYKTIISSILSKAHILDSALNMFKFSLYDLILC